MTLAYVPPATAPAAPAAQAEVAATCPRRGSRDCFPDDLVGPAANRGSGLIAYPLPPQCNGPAEDPKRCSREGNQAGPAGGWIEGQITVPYTVWVAGYQTIKAPSGEPISRELETPVIHLNVPNGGSFGVGETEFISAYVAEHFPGYTVMDAMIDRAGLSFKEF